jgi:hypothetical protein
MILALLTGGGGVFGVFGQYFGMALSGETSFECQMNRRNKVIGNLFSYAHLKETLGPSVIKALMFPFLVAPYQYPVQYCNDKDLLAIFKTNDQMPEAADQKMYD